MATPTTEMATAMATEEVLRARYSDAEYFFNHDRQHESKKSCGTQPRNLSGQTRLHADKC